MAAMDQAKLSSLCSSLSSSAEEYTNNIVADAQKVVDEFNANWVSNAARSLALEIGECLGSLKSDISKTFALKNSAIAAAVSNFNQLEDENISYKGFAFNNPSTPMELNETLPNGKVGVADGADIDSIRNPMKLLVKNINTTLANVVSTVKSCDAFDTEEVNALTTGIESIKNRFESGMQELESTLETRMSGEIANREALANANKEILQ